eukprot:m51a1_g2896 hypothetical protein (421) ;mRNA; f:455334-460411
MPGVGDAVIPSSGFVGGATRAAVAERTLQVLVDATPEFGKDVEMRLVETMEDPHVAGWSITTHQQTIDGIPIVGALLKARLPTLLCAVWNAEGEVVSVTGTTVADAHERTHLRSRTAVSQEEAVRAAQREAVARDVQARCGEARRVVLRPGMANGEPGPNLPVWEVLCGTADVYVSTQSPRVLALNPRKMSLVANVTDFVTGATLWKSGQPFPADPEIQTVVKDIAVAEELWRNFSGRNGFDNKGTAMAVQIHDTKPGAYWDPSNRGIIVFGNGMVSRTILWHEYGHGITAFLDKLWYEAQSGALNEAWSDIFAGSVDILVNNHTVCFDLEGVRVVASDSLFGAIEAQTNSGGCATLKLELNIEYNITATKDDYTMHQWTHTLANSTEVLRFTMVRSTGERTSVAVQLALLCAVARLWAL